MLRQLTQRAGFALLEARPMRPVPVTAGGESSLTCLLRLPLPLCQEIESTVRAWPGAEAHRVYPAGRLHVTVLNLAEIEGDDDARASVVRLLDETPPVALTLRGFGATPHSVFVRAFDTAGDLVALRRRLIALTGASPSWQRRRLGVVNVLRYRTGEVRTLLRAAGAADLGPVELVLDRAEIVRTDRLFSSGGTSVLRSVQLSGQT